MANEETYEGTCFCGKVTLEVSGSPVAQGFCHCESCRKWSASPINGFSLWKLGTVKVTKGAELVDSYAKTKFSTRKWCKSCGGHLFTDHPLWEVTDVFAATIPDFPFKPGLHVNYQETVLRVRDGLPKMKDMPSDMGGSGETLAE